MTATATPILNPTHEPVRPAAFMSIGLHEERPSPSRALYQAMAAVTTTSVYSSPRLDHGTDRQRANRHAALVLVKTDRQNAADAAHIRLLESAAPLMAMGASYMQQAIEIMNQTLASGVHQVLLWSNGLHARLIFQGNHRIIYIHEGKASKVTAQVPFGVAHCEMRLAPGDTIVITSNDAHAALPLGSVAEMASEASTPQILCQRISTQAAVIDPRGHHAALALTIAPLASMP